MNRSSGIFVLLVLAFGGGFMTRVLYQRWNPALAPTQIAPGLADPLLPQANAPGFRVSFVPSPPPAMEPSGAELTPILARDLEKIRSMVGQQARIRGRVFRIGHSAKSNTYFIDFGPSQEALTAVIFNSAVELFEKNKQPPRHFENREVEIVGQVKEHPQYGLEVILEHPRQIKIVN